MGLSGGEFDRNQDLEKNTHTETELTYLLFCLMISCLICAQPVISYVIYPLVSYMDSTGTMICFHFCNALLNLGLSIMSEKFNMQTQAEHLHMKYVGTGHPDITKLYVSIGLLPHCERCYQV
jgi:hypothetical protein